MRLLCAVATESIATFSAKLFVVAHGFCIVISVVYSSSDAGRGQPCDSVSGLLLAPRVLEYGLPSPGITMPAIGAGLGWRAACRRWVDRGGQTYPRYEYNCGCFSSSDVREIATEERNLADRTAAI